MAQFADELLVELLAPGFLEFTQASIEDLRERHPEARHWIANHFLNSVLRGRFRREMKPMVLNILYRAQAAFHAYHEAREQTLEFIAGAGSPGIALYFGGLAQWEAAVLHTQIAQEIIVKMTGQPMFSKNDGGDDDRLWKLAGRIKHSGRDMASGEHDERYAVPIWLTNEGLQSRTAGLTWTEITTHVDGLACLADTLQDPLMASEKHRRQAAEASR